MEDLARSFLGETEAEAFAAMTGRARIPWLLGRVAAKNAVRDHLASREFASFDPTRIVVTNDANGCPNVQVRGARLATRGIQVSIAHKPTVAVALAARVRGPASTKGITPKGKATAPAGIGIDIEAVEQRPLSFAEMILSLPERLLLKARSDDRDSWLTRMWAVKEATAKATGLGLRGRPKDFEVDAIDDDRLRCCGRWITTAPLHTGDGRFIVAWTDTV
ncbi:MAG TPA: 4'-phosphopantetheinyl transferase superfamily protein [Acidimicrobiales bacterium]|nr:4'-phosphopantetheinyl transferase superfamily protein [Acidimicrobiales bacterium]